MHASTTGIFLGKSEVLKCVSIILAPSSNSANFSYPIDKLMETPTELHNENLPPTQSHIGNIF